eukprot:GFYU01018959.1.p1 GENE.GFYU01018959.1~~GFYU01018959.1.p1  ORF type:complete len:391 (-),score=33.67 GFYU01018959.1:119-1207(-)
MVAAEELRQRKRPAKEGSGSEESCSEYNKNWIVLEDVHKYSDTYPSWMVDSFSMVTMLVFFTTFPAVPFGTVALFVAGLWYEQWWTFVVLVILYSTLLIPYGYSWRFMHSRVFKFWREYFRFRIVLPRNMPDEEHLLACEVPHGLFPMGQFLAGTGRREDFGIHEGHSAFEMLNHSRHGLGADVIYKVPVIRHLYGMMGTVPCDRNTFRTVIRKYPRTAIIPGGIAEMCYSGIHTEDENLYILKRKGFVKLAIEAGVDLAPIYIFGNTDLMDRLSSHRGWFTWAARKLRMSVLLPYGRYFLPIPYKRPMVWAMGMPVHVPKTENPTNEQVEEVHARLVAAIKDLYYTHRHLIGWEKKELVLH